MKTLVILCHPNRHKGVVNNAIVEVWRNTDVIVHELYERYPDEAIDVEFEQQYLKQFDHIIFQFPIFWYAPPHLVLKWNELVLTYGFAYGKTGNALEGKTFQLLVTTGRKKEDYTKEGSIGYTLTELLRSLELTMKMTKVKYLPPIVLYRGQQSTSEELQLQAKACVTTALKNRSKRNETKI